MSYTKEGIVVRRLSGYGPKEKTIPWDSVRKVRLKINGEVVVRHSVVLKEEYFPIYVPGNGVGGFKRAIDVGRRLVADQCADGTWVDYLEAPEPPKSKRRRRA